jgi:hypothetical protein
VAINANTFGEHVSILDGDRVNQGAHDSVTRFGCAGINGGVQLELEFRAFRNCDLINGGVAILRKEGRRHAANQRARDQ